MIEIGKIGLKYPVYKTATAQGVIGKAIQADISISVNDVAMLTMALLKATSHFKAAP